MMGWLRKDFSKRGRVPPKNPRRGRGVLFGCLIDKNDSEGQRQGPLPCRATNTAPKKLASATKARPPVLGTAGTGISGAILNTSLVGNLIFYLTKLANNKTPRRPRDPSQPLRDDLGSV